MDKKKIEIKDAINEKECCCTGECKKRKTWLFLIIVIVLLGIAFVGGMFVGKEYFDDNDTSVTNDKLNDNKEEVKKDCVNEDMDLSDYEKIEQVINDLSNIEQVSRNINSVSDFTNQELLLFAMNYLGYSESHTLEEVNAVTLSFFGVTIKPEDVDCHYPDDVPIFLYDEVKQAFIPNEEHGAHGLGSYYSYILNRIVKFEKNDNIYTIEVKKAFGRSQDTGPVTTFYKSYKEMAELKIPIIDYCFEPEDEVGNFVPEVYFNDFNNDQLNSYIYVFEKLNDDFILKSYTFE